MSVIEGDCVEVIAGMEPESVDAIVTDPPYDLTSTGARNGSPRNPGTGPYSRGFMGKAWDGTGVAFRPETWAECFRVAKPSAYLLAFGGTRTVHRMTTAIEDAGWIIRDMLVWAYASGFPKSKASLKPAWEPIVMARKPGPLRMLAIDECRIPFVSSSDAAAAAAAAAVGYSRSMELGTISEPTSLPTSYDKPPYDPDAIAGRWPANVILTDPIFDGDIAGVVGGGEASTGGSINGRPVTGYSKGWADERFFESYGDSGTYSRFFLIPRRYNDPCSECGRASSVEPPSSRSSEPAASAPSHAQTGAFDAPGTTTGSPITSAIGTPSSSGGDATTPRIPRSKRRAISPESEPASSPAKSPDAASPATDTTTTTDGPWTCGTCAGPTTSATTSRSPVPADGPDYTRFLLIPKADRTDREPVLGAAKSQPGHLTLHSQPTGAPPPPPPPRANVHPTVKPTDLMRHLVRLVTPAGGTVLDPFLGSGTTALAAELEGFPWIGIEKEPEYVAIAEARLNGTQRGMGLVG